MFLLAIALVGCGGSTSMGGQVVVNNAATSVSLTVGDDPPAGLAVLRFQVQITDSSLLPANPSQPAVHMLLSPFNVELLHLQTETAPLGNAVVPTGTYNGLSASFANPQMTVLNNTGHTLTVGPQSCLADQVCIFNPPLDQTTASVAAPTAPFPITLSATSPVGFEMHFDVNASVQGDLSISPKITLKQVIPPNATTPVGQFHVVGRVAAVSSPTFTIQTGFGNISAMLTTDANTAYDFGSACAAENFSCITVGQVVGVAVNVLSNTTLEATRVKLLEQQNRPAVEGIVVRTNAAQNTFDVILQDLQENFTSVNFGMLATVHVDSSTTYEVDADGATLPGALTFTGIQSLVAGQTVEIHPSASPVVTPVPAAAPLISISADNVSLEASEVNGTVGTTNPGGTPPAFTMDPASPLFTHAGINLIQVDTLGATRFIDVSGVSGLTSGDRVSVGGLLFNTAGTPTMVAARVRKH
jgi:hypothetical protein